MRQCFSFEEAKKHMDNGLIVFRERYLGIDGDRGDSPFLAVPHTDLSFCIALCRHTPVKGQYYRYVWNKKLSKLIDSLRECLFTVQFSNKKIRQNFLSCREIMDVVICDADKIDLNIHPLSSPHDNKTSTKEDDFFLYPNNTNQHAVCNLLDYLRDIDLKYLASTPEWWAKMGMQLA